MTSASIEAVLRVDVLAERELRAGARVLAARRIPLMPFADGKRARRSRICAASVGELTDSVRMRRPAPLSGCCAVSAARIAPRNADHGTNLAEVGQRLRAIGIVEAEDRRLREDVGGAEAARVQRVAFDLRRPALVALDQQAGGDAAERHRGREEQRLARDHLFGLPDVRDDLLRRLTRAGGDAGQRHRRAHQLQKRPPRHRIGDRFDSEGNSLYRRSWNAGSSASSSSVRQNESRIPNSDSRRGFSVIGDTSSSS